MAKDLRLAQYMAEKFPTWPLIALLHGYLKSLLDIRAQPFEVDPSFNLPAGLEIMERAFRCLLAMLKRHNIRCDDVTKLDDLLPPADGYLSPASSDPGLILDQYCSFIDQLPAAMQALVPLLTEANTHQLSDAQPPNTAPFTFMDDGSHTYDAPICKALGISPPYVSPTHHHCLLYIVKTFPSWQQYVDIRTQIAGIRSRIACVRRRIQRIPTQSAAIPPQSAAISTQNARTRIQIERTRANNARTRRRSLRTRTRIARIRTQSARTRNHIDKPYKNFQSQLEEGKLDLVSQLFFHLWRRLHQLQIGKAITDPLIRQLFKALGLRQKSLNSAGTLECYAKFLDQLPEAMESLVPLLEQLIDQLDNPRPPKLLPFTFMDHGSDLFEEYAWEVLDPFDYHD